MNREKAPFEETNENLAPKQEAVVVQMSSEENEKQSEEKAVSKEKDQARILELQNELTGSKKQETYIEDVKFVKESLALYKRMAKDHGIDTSTIIKDTGVLDGKEHSFIFPNLEVPSKDKDLYLGMLGSMATSLEVDLSPGLSVEQVISIIESRIAVSEDHKMAA